MAETNTAVMLDTIEQAKEPENLIENLTAPDALDIPVPVHNEINSGESVTLSNVIDGIFGDNHSITAKTDSRDIRHEKGEQFLLIQSRENGLSI